MKAYVLMRWVDGFGNDTQVLGIYENLEKIYELHSAQYLLNCRYQEIEMNEFVDIDYSEGKKFKFKFRLKKKRDKEKGHIHCPANGYDCPYWKNGLCGLWSKKEGYADPLAECDDFGAFWDKGDDYIDYGED